MEQEVKVIVIKLPFDLQERILTFPFLHMLKEKYPEADFHFITPKKYIEVLNLLPFSAYYHEFDEDEITTIFDVHRFTATAKVYNVDLFISLTNSFVDACLGLGLRAKKRAGFSDGWKTMLLTHKLPRPRGHHVCEDFFALYREITGESVSNRLRVLSRDLGTIVADSETQPYIAINLSPLRNAEIEYELFELISLFDNQRIVLFASEEQEKVQNLMEPFLARLPKRNQYVNFIYKNWIDLAKMCAHAKGVITFSGSAAALSAYVGSKTLIMYDREDPKRYGPFYFLSDVMILGANDPTLMNSVTSGKVLQERKSFSMEQVFQKAHEFFRLTT